MPGHKPSFVKTSLPHTPHACTLIRTCPAAGLGTSRSTIWNSDPGFGTTATFIVATSTAVGAISPLHEVCYVAAANAVIDDAPYATRAPARWSDEVRQCRAGRYGG